MPPANPLFTSDAEEHNAALKCYEMHRGQLQHEDNLLGQRTTWVVSSQAFLLGTYVFLLNSPLLHLVGKIDVSGNMGYPSDPKTRFKFVEFQAYIENLRSIFQFVGFWSSIVIFISAWAAIRALKVLIDNYNRTLIKLVDPSDPLDGNLIEKVKTIHEKYGMPRFKSRRWMRYGGLVAPIFLGPIFALAWVAVRYKINPFDIQKGAAVFWIVLVIVAVLAGLILAIDSEKD